MTTRAKGAARGRWIWVGALAALAVVVAALAWASSTEKPISVSHPGGAVRYTQPSSIMGGKRWDDRSIEFESITVGPSGDVVRGVAYLDRGDRVANFEAVSPCPSNLGAGGCEWRLVGIPTVARHTGAYPFRVVYPNMPGADVNPSILPRFELDGLTLTRQVTLSRAVTLPLPASGVTMGSVAGDRVRVDSLDADGLDTTQTYAVPHRITVWSGIFGIGATHVPLHPSAQGHVQGGSVRVGGRAYALTNNGGVTLGPEVVPVNLSWKTAVPLLGKRERVTLTVVVGESWQFPTAEHAWPAYPWLWQLLANPLPG